MIPAMLLACLAQEGAPLVERRLAAMGTALVLEVGAADRAAALLASEAALRAIEAAEERLSTWSETSELARLNQAPVGEWFQLSPALEADLARARELSLWSGGAFDPGLGALVEAWGLRSGGRQPEPRELEEARAVGGVAAFEFAPGRARRRHARAAIEEGGFGKGLALDQALAALRAAGGSRAWLDLGGQVLLDLPEERELELADPRERARPVLALALHSGSLATSGNSERGIVVAGQRRSHLLDPARGEPAPDFGSLSVWAADATRADALSTGLFVLGPEAAFARVAAEPELALVVLEPARDGLRARVSAALRGRVRALVDDLHLEFVAAPAAAPSPPPDPPMNRQLTTSLALVSLATLARAQGDDTAARLSTLERKNAELEARLEALADEQEGFSLGGLVPPRAGSAYGLGPSASKVYSASEGLSIGGYGEALYERRNGDVADEIDALRVVTYLGYRFDEHWLFNSEIEFEHAGEEVGVEFAYLDYLWRESLNFRMGLVLIPMGFVNELHEPPTFLAAKRPETERRILPSTWREEGVGVFGDAGGVSYRAYVVNGFDATGFTDAGLRGGRQNGSEALAEDLAFVARADWTETPGLLAGGSFYVGNSGQEQAGLESTGVTALELHGEWRAGGLWARALAAMAEVDDVAELNAANGFVGADSVGEELEGWYVEAGYDLLTLCARGSEQALSPYVRYEALDTQAEVPSGFASDPANDFDILTAGLNWRPRSNLVFKAEYQDFEAAEDGWNVLMGFSF